MRERLWPSISKSGWGGGGSMLEQDGWGGGGMEDEG